MIVWWTIKKIMTKNVTNPGQAFKQILGAIITQPSKDNYSVNLWEVN